MTELATYEQPAPGLDSQVEYARLVAAADMLPNAYRGKPANVLLAIGLGQSMGLSPAESLYRIAVIQGKPTASAELVAANVRKAGHRLRVTIEPGKATCTIWRSDDPEFAFEVVRDAAWAQAMGLAQNDNYKKQGDTMLSWRAITACARLACPEALYGVAYTSDEMYDMSGGERVRHEVTVEQTSAPAEPNQGAATDSVEPPTADVEQPAGAEPDEVMTKRTRGQMFALFEKKGVDETEQLPGINHITGKTYTSRADVTEADGLAVIEVLLKRPDVIKPAADEPVDAEIVQ
jgi:hypothetical protein